MAKQTVTIAEGTNTHPSPPPPHTRFNSEKSFLHFALNFARQNRFILTFFFFSDHKLFIVPLLTFHLQFKGEKMLTTIEAIRLLNTIRAPEKTKNLSRELSGKS